MYLAPMDLTQARYPRKTVAINQGHTPSEITVSTIRHSFQTNILQAKRVQKCGGNLMLFPNQTHLYSAIYVNTLISSNRQDLPFDYCVNHGAL
jgi:hypothetical protein